MPTLTIYLSLALQVQACPISDCFGWLNQRWRISQALFVLLSALFDFAIKDFEDVLQYLRLWGEASKRIFGKNLWPSQFLMGRRFASPYPICLMILSSASALITNWCTKWQKRLYYVRNVNRPSSMSAEEIRSRCCYPFTEWPTSGYSIKTLTLYLGFYWRDKKPSSKGRLSPASATEQEIGILRNVQTWQQCKRG